MNANPLIAPQAASAQAVSPQATTATGASSSAAGTPASSNPNGILGQNDFLKLMVAQLQAQNPLEPGNSNEFVNELAQFTQVEQVTNLANANELSSAVQLIGHKVTYNGASGEAATGIVQSVQSSSSGTTVTVEGVARREAREHHGSAVSPISNPALVPPGNLGPGRAPVGAVRRRARRPPRPGPSFADALSAGGIESAPTLQFSKHALARVERRGIELGAGTLGRLSQGVDRAASKGSRDSLVLVDGTAFVVSVSNRTVITAVGSEHMKDNVFTNIDSAVIA